MPALVRLPYLVTSFWALLWLCGCNLLALNQSNKGQPNVVPPQSIPPIIKDLPANVGFGYSGLTFFNGKLYATSNIGLLEYEGTTLSRLYKWREKDDVISGPWLDQANNSLWAFHNGINKLIRFDGKSWTLMDLPRPEDGYSRGDMLMGFRGISSNHAFWLQGGGIAWQWDAGKKAWLNVSVPDTGLFVGRRSSSRACSMLQRRDRATHNSLCLESIFATQKFSISQKRKTSNARINAVAHNEPGILVN